MSDTFEVRKYADDEYAVYDEGGEFICSARSYGEALEALASIADAGRWHKRMEVYDE